jgi:hypothetical protein
MLSLCVNYMLRSCLRITWNMYIDVDMCVLCALLTKVRVLIKVEHVGDH